MPLREKSQAKGKTGLERGRKRWYNEGMKLILCCDYGIDDAAATVDALLHAEEDGYSEVVLVAVGGNVPRGVALRNGAKLLAQCRFPHPPVTLVDTTALSQPGEFLKAIHGDDGMGDLFPDVPVRAVPYAEWLSSLRGGYRLLSLGPMTLILPILERGTCERFVFMGGNIAEEPNYHGYEFNHALDRTAFAEAVKFPHAAVTMDTCRHPLFNIQPVDFAADTLLKRIVLRARERTFLSGEKGCYLWDDIAVKVLRHPEWFAFEERSDRDGNVLCVARYVRGLPYPEVLEQ